MKIVSNGTANGFSPAQQRIHRSMVDLLGCAGLEYRGGFVNAGRYRVHYLEYGSGPVVLLIHGGGAGSAIWFRQIAALSRHYRVIAPDNPVFGLSTQPPYAVPLVDTTSGYLAPFMDAMKLDRASFVGLSLGGFASARIAAEAPERVEKLVLIDSAGFGRDLPWGFRITSLPLIGHVLALPHRKLHARFFATNEVVYPDNEHNDTYLEYAYHVTKNDGHSESIRHNMQEFAGLRGQRNLMTDEELRAVKAETLVIWGREDRFFPLSHARRAVSLIGNSRLEVLDECGHVALLDQPERVTSLISGFLGQSSGAEAGAFAQSR